MVLSRTATKHDEMSSFYMPLLTGQLNSEIQNQIDRLKDDVVENGGKRNVSCTFLQRGCQDKICKSSNSIVCRGVLQIPRTIIQKKLLQQLDHGM